MSIICIFGELSRETKFLQSKCNHYFCNPWLQKSVPLPILRIRLLNDMRLPRYVFTSPIRQQLVAQFHSFLYFTRHPVYHIIFIIGTEYYFIFFVSDLVFEDVEINFPLPTWMYLVFDYVSPIPRLRFNNNLIVYNSMYPSLRLA